MQILEVTHLDHGLMPAHINFLQGKFADRTSFFVETVELPAELPDLSCGLYGPLMGDAPVLERDVFYKRRGIREYNSRLVNRPMRPTRLMTVVAGPHDGIMTLYTAYGGPKAPREVYSPGLTRADVVESEAFWSEHAISANDREF